MSSRIEPEPERERKWRKSGAREGVYKRNGAAVVRQSSAFSFKKTRPPAPLHILRLALYVFDSTPSEIATSQKWESPGGAATPLFYASFTVSFRFMLSF